MFSKRAPNKIYQYSIFLTIYVLMIFINKTIHQTNVRKTILLLCLRQIHNLRTRPLKAMMAGWQWLKYATKKNEIKGHSGQINLREKNR